MTRRPPKPAFPPPASQAGGESERMGTVSLFNASRCVWVAGTWRSGESWLPISEISCRQVMPDDTLRFEVTADRDVDVRLRGFCFKTLQSCEWTGVIQAGEKMRIEAA